MSEHSQPPAIQKQEGPTLAVGIPADRTIDWTSRILAGLSSPAAVGVEVLVARWTEHPLTSQEHEDLNAILLTTEVPSETKHAPAMRNAIIQAATATHVLFLDDDMVPGQNLLGSALNLARREPDTVHQGIPYRVANADNWLARKEGLLYEKGYAKYINADDSVTLLDPRLLLAPVETLRQTPFDESLVFSAGEGSELARSLIERGTILRIARELDAAHINRDTIASLAAQKIAHGKGRGYELQQHGPGENGWLDYIRTYARRHYIDPALQTARGEMDPDELVYIWGTNTAMWAGVFDYLLHASQAE